MSSSWPPDGAAGAGRSVVAAGTDGLFRLVDTVGWSSCGCYGAIFADPRRRFAGMWSTPRRVDRRRVDGERERRGPPSLRAPPHVVGRLRSRGASETHRPETRDPVLERRVGREQLRDVRACERAHDPQVAEGGIGLRLRLAPPGKGAAETTEESLLALRRLERLERLRESLGVTRQQRTGRVRDVLPPA